MDGAGISLYSVPNQQLFSFAKWAFPVRWWASIFSLLHCRLQTSQKLNDIRFSTFSVWFFPFRCSASVFLLLQCKLQSLQKYVALCISVSSELAPLAVLEPLELAIWPPFRRASTFCWCPLLLQWFSNWDTELHLAWQIPQPHSVRYCLPSTWRTRKFSWCLFPLRWFAKSDWRLHLAWQRLQFHVEAGLLSSSCVTMFGCEFSDPQFTAMFLHSSSRDWIFALCLLPLRWSSRFDLQVQLDWQNLQTQVRRGFSSYCRIFSDFAAAAFAFWLLALFLDTKAATLDRCFCPAKCCCKWPSVGAPTRQMSQLHFTEEGVVFLANVVC